MKILLVGVVTREIAKSAVDAGYHVISLDYFGDSDQPASAEVYSLVRDFHCEPNLNNLTVAAKTLVSKAERVVLGAGLENGPSFFELGSNKKRWSNTRASVQLARDIRWISVSLQVNRLLFPKTIFPGDPLPQTGHWLIKDDRLSGGLGVREWDGMTQIHNHEVLQEKIKGDLMSACFVADGRHARLLGISRQYAGIPELNAPTYFWCGNVAPYRDTALEKIIFQVVEQLTELTGLIGVNGIDFIQNEKNSYLLEVNPRWTGSLELFERLYGINMFQMHVEACEGRSLRELPPLKEDIAWGKGILYSNQKITLGDTSGWRELGFSDIPHLGEIIPGGNPVCTLLHNSENIFVCWKEILKEAKRFQRMISSSL